MDPFAHHQHHYGATAPVSTSEDQTPSSSGKRRHDEAALLGHQQTSGYAYSQSTQDGKQQQQHQQQASMTMEDARLAFSPPPPPQQQQQQQHYAGYAQPGNPSASQDLDYLAGLISEKTAQLASSLTPAQQQQQFYQYQADTGSADALAYQLGPEHPQKMAKRGGGGQQHQQQQPQHQQQHFFVGREHDAAPSYAGATKQEPLLYPTQTPADGFQQQQTEPPLTAQQIAYLQLKQMLTSQLPVPEQPTLAALSGSPSGPTMPAASSSAVGAGSLLSFLVLNLEKHTFHQVNCYASASNEDLNHILSATCGPPIGTFTLRTTKGTELRTGADLMAIWPITTPVVLVNNSSLATFNAVTQKYASAAEATPGQLHGGLAPSPLAPSLAGSVAALHAGVAHEASPASSSAALDAAEKKKIISVEEARYLMNNVDTFLTAIGLRSQKEKAHFLSRRGVRISQQHYSSTLISVASGTWDGGHKASRTIRRMQEAVVAMARDDLYALQQEVKELQQELKAKARLSAAKKKRDGQPQRHQMKDEEDDQDQPQQHYRHHHQGASSSSGGGTYSTYDQQPHSHASSSSGTATAPVSSMHPSAPRYLPTQSQQQQQQQQQQQRFSEGTDTHARYQHAGSYQQLQQLKKPTDVAALTTSLVKSLAGFAPSPASTPSSSSSFTAASVLSTLSSAHQLQMKDGESNEGVTRHVDELDSTVLATTPRRDSGFTDVEPHSSAGKSPHHGFQLPKYQHQPRNELRGDPIHTDAALPQHTQQSSSSAYFLDDHSTLSHNASQSNPYTSSPLPSSYDAAPASWASDELPTVASSVTPGGQRTPTDSEAFGVETNPYFLAQDGGSAYVATASFGLSPSLRTAFLKRRLLSAKATLHAGRDIMDEAVAHSPLTTDRPLSEPEAAATSFGGRFAPQPQSPHCLTSPDGPAVSTSSDPLTPPVFSSASSSSHGVFEADPFLSVDDDDEVESFMNFLSHDSKIAAQNEHSLPSLRDPQAPVLDEDNLVDFDETSNQRAQGVSVAAEPYGVIPPAGSLALQTIQEPSSLAGAASETRGPNGDVDLHMLLSEPAAPGDCCVDIYDTHVAEEKPRKRTAASPRLSATVSPLSDSTMSSLAPSTASSPHQSGSSTRSSPHSSPRSTSSSAKSSRKIPNHITNYLKHYFFNVNRLPTRADKEAIRVKHPSLSLKQLNIFFQNMRARNKTKK